MIIETNDNSEKYPTVHNKKRFVENYQPGLSPNGKYN